jgi:hypothetical protein
MQLKGTDLKIETPFLHNTPMFSSQRKRQREPGPKVTQALDSPESLSTFCQRQNEKEVFGRLTGEVLREEGNLRVNHGEHLKYRREKNELDRKRRKAKSG